MKLGSLFDGSGGFPLSAAMCGIEPVWAAEVEPYPIAVTRSRFPNMKHLGSVTDVKGAHVEPVDVITFGSPCQDLSVAGKRAGLKHTENGDEETTRSGLFMEAVRIIKEMRGATNGVYPRFAVWENVPGAFSSNKGEDFRIVLEELIKIIEPTAVMPAVPKNGWPYADSYCGDGWSIAYRVFDAQFWGVPQRRRRIYLVADFRGQRAGKISFERDGLRGYFETGRTPWQETAGDAENCVGTADCTGIGLDLYNHAISGDKAVTLTSMMHKGGTMSGPTVAVPNLVLDDQGGSQISVRTDGKSPTLRAEMHGNVPCVMEAAGFKAGQSIAGGIGWQMECAATLAAECSGTEPTVCIKEQHLFENHSQDSRYKRPLDVCPMLPAQLGTGGNNQPFVVEGFPPDSYWDGGQIRGTLTANNAGGNQRMPDKENFNCVIALDRAFYNQGQNAQYEPQFYTDGTVPTLVAKGPGAVAVRYIVRRLTPTECARLQGFPDNWAHPDIKESLSDEEYAFWLNVRNTHAEINGKATKEYTREQMLTWYNKLHTDSSEYKMWGNGIALPCALYVMQGIAKSEEV